MSDFIAEGRILVRPDTTKFAAELQAQLRSITSTPITIPVVAALSGSVTSAAAATGSLVAAQRSAETSALGLTSAENVLNTTLGRQATILEGATVATAGLASAQVAGAAAARSSAAANALSASNLADARRGIVATALQFIGLRGATLSASGGFLAAAAGAVAFTKSISLFANFEQQLNVFEVTAAATAEEMQRVSDTARELGRDLTLPGVSASDAAETLTQLARAGLDVNESLAAVRGTLQLATAAQIDNASATELVANALNAFKLPGRDAVKVADLLAGASAEAQGSILDMGLALKQVAPVAALLNISVEDTITLLTQLARSGLSSSDAGTSLRQAFLRLIQDMPKVNEAVSDLGLNLRDAQGEIRPEVFGELGKALQGLGRAEREAKIAALGGADAIRALGLLARDGAGAFDLTRAAVTEAGRAQELAAAQTKGLKGDSEALKNEIAELGLTFGTVASGPVGAFVRAMTGATAAINNTVEAAGRTGVFERIGKEIGEFGTAFSRLNVSFRQGVTGADQTSSAFSHMDAITQALTGSVNALTQALEDAAAAQAAKHPEAGKGLFLGPTEKGEVAGILAGGTEGLEDDIAAAQARLNRINGQLEDFHGNRNQFAAKVREQAEAQADLNRLLGQQAAQQAAAAKAAQTAAQQAAAAAQAEFLARQALAREQGQNAIAAAGLTVGVQDDIKAWRAFGAVIVQQIAAVRATVKDKLAQAQAIAALVAVQIQVNSNIDALIAQQKGKAQERRDALTDILGLRVRLAGLRFNAETGAGKDVLLKALNAAIADAKKRIKAAKTVAERLDEQIALQELINQKNDILAQTTQKGNDAAKFFFEQLQAQQGFAANLLGNLIPSGQTGGLVGIPSPASVGKPGISGDIVQAALGARSAAQEGKGQTSPTAGQASTTNEILRRILRVLEVMNRGAEAPEANYGAAMGLAVMDGGGGSVFQGGV